MKRNILAILTLLCLHGCKTVEDPFLESMNGRMPVSSGNRELPVDLASASLTGLGEMPIGLRQTSVDASTRQVLIWANTTTIAGENTLTISQSSPPRSAPLKGPDRSEITRSLRSEFPGVAMSIDSSLRQNAYGVYGTATGKLGQTGGCVYAWQNIDRTNSLVDLRLRYCHASLGPERLAELLDGLVLRHAPPLSAGPSAAYGYQGASLATRANSDAITADTDVEVAASEVLAPAKREKSDDSGTATLIPMPE